MSNAHNERAIAALRGDVDMWRDIAVRWIREAVETQLRLNAVHRALASQLRVNSDLRATIERLGDQRDELTELREERARLARTVFAEVRADAS